MTNFSLCIGIFLFLNAINSVDGKAKKVGYNLGLTTASRDSMTNEIIKVQLLPSRGTAVDDESVKSLHQHKSVPASARIPAGVSEGETFTIQVGGRTIALTVPEGKKSGDNMMFDFPDDDDEVVRTVDEYPEAGREQELQRKEAPSFLNIIDGDSGETTLPSFVQPFEDYSINLAAIDENSADTKFPEQDKTHSDSLESSSIDLGQSNQQNQVSGFSDQLSNDSSQIAFQDTLPIPDQMDVTGAELEELDRNDGWKKEFEEYILENWFDFGNQHDNKYLPIKLAQVESNSNQFNLDAVKTKEESSYQDKSQKFSDKEDTIHQITDVEDLINSFYPNDLPQSQLEHYILKNWINSEKEGSDAHIPMDSEANMKQMELENSKNLRPDDNIPTKSAPSIEQMKLEHDFLKNWFNSENQGKDQPVVSSDSNENEVFLAESKQNSERTEHVAEAGEQAELETYFLKNWFNSENLGKGQAVVSSHSNENEVLAESKQNSDSIEHVAETGEQAELETDFLNNWFNSENLGKDQALGTLNSNENEVLLSESKHNSEKIENMAESNQELKGAYDLTWENYSPSQQPRDSKKTQLILPYDLVSQSDVEDKIVSTLQNYILENYGIQGEDIVVVHATQQAINELVQSTDIQSDQETERKEEAHSQVQLSFGSSDAVDSRNKAISSDISQAELENIDILKHFFLPENWFASNNKPAKDVLHSNMVDQETESTQNVQERQVAISSEDIKSSSNVFTQNLRYVRSDAEMEMPADSKEILEEKQDISLDDNLVEPFVDTTENNQEKEGALSPDDTEASNIVLPQTVEPADLGLEAIVDNIEGIEEKEQDTPTISKEIKGPQNEASEAISAPLDSTQNLDEKLAVQSSEEPNTSNDIFPQNYVHSDLEMEEPAEIESKEALEEQDAIRDYLGLEPPVDTTKDVQEEKLTAEDVLRSALVIDNFVDSTVGSDNAVLEVERTEEALQDEHDDTLDDVGVEPRVDTTESEPAQNNLGSAVVVDKVVQSTENVQEKQDMLASDQTEALKNALLQLEAPADSKTVLQQDPIFDLDPVDSPKTVQEQGVPFSDKTTPSNSEPTQHSFLVDSTENVQENQDVLSADKTEASNDAFLQPEVPADFKIVAEQEQNAIENLNQGLESPVDHLHIDAGMEEHVDPKESFQDTKDASSAEVTEPSSTVFPLMEMPYSNTVLEEQEGIFDLELEDIIDTTEGVEVEHDTPFSEDRTASNNEPPQIRSDEGKELPMDLTEHEEEKQDVLSRAVVVDKPVDLTENVQENQKVLSTDETEASYNALLQAEVPADLKTVAEQEQDAIENLNSGLESHVDYLHSDVVNEEHVDSKESFQDKKDALSLEETEPSNSVFPLMEMPDSKTVLEEQDAIFDLGLEGALDTTDDVEDEQDKLFSEDSKASNSEPAQLGSDEIKESTVDITEREEEVVVDKPVYSAENVQEKQYMLSSDEPDMSNNVLSPVEESVESKIVVQPEQHPIFKLGLQAPVDTSKEEVQVVSFKETHALPNENNQDMLSSEDIKSSYNQFSQDVVSNPVFVDKPSDSTEHVQEKQDVLSSDETDPSNKVLKNLEGSSDFKTRTQQEPYPIFDLDHRRQAPVYAAEVAYEEQDSSVDVVQEENQGDVAEQPRSKASSPDKNDETDQLQKINAPVAVTDIMLTGNEEKLNTEATVTDKTLELAKEILKLNQEGLSLKTDVLDDFKDLDRQVEVLSDTIVDTFPTEQTGIALEQSTETLQKSPETDETLELAKEILKLNQERERAAKAEQALEAALKEKEEVLAKLRAAQEFFNSYVIPTVLQSNEQETGMAQENKKDMQEENKQGIKDNMWEKLKKIIFEPVEHFFNPSNYHEATLLESANVALQETKGSLENVSKTSEAEITLKSSSIVIADGLSILSGFIGMSAVLLIFFKLNFKKKQLSVGHACSNDVEEGVLSVYQSF